MPGCTVLHRCDSPHGARRAHLRAVVIALRRHIRPILWRPLIGVAYWPWHVVFLGQCRTRAAYAPCVISRGPLGKWPAGARPLGGFRNCTPVGTAGGGGPSVCGQPSALTSHFFSESNSLMVLGEPVSKTSPLFFTKAPCRGWRSALSQC